MLDNTVNSLVKIIELRDPYTSGHQKRVSRLALAIARELGLSEREVKLIKIAALVHDIGKTSIPAEILSKPDKLAEIEFSLIRTHSQTGYDILKNINFPWAVEEIVLQHHERIDGSGYPHKLKGDKILVEAKIMGVADVVEAISSHRPYRPALGIDKALEESPKIEVSSMTLKWSMSALSYLERKDLSFNPALTRLCSIPYLYL